MRSLSFPGLPSIEYFLENLDTLGNIHGVNYLLHYALEWFYPYYNISPIVSMVIDNFLNKNSIIKL